MERLIQKANELKKANGEAGDLSIDKFSDVVEAIQLVQKNLGIAGVAANEAKTTFSGSFEAMKASVSDLMAHMTNGMDITADVQHIVTTCGWFLSNLFRFMGNLAMSLPKAVLELIKTGGPAIFNGLQSLIEEASQSMGVSVNQLFGTVCRDIMAFIPQVLNSGTEMVNQFFDGFSKAVPQIASVAFDLVTGFVDAVLTYLPEIITAGFNLIISLKEGLVNGSIEIDKAIADLVNNLGEWIGSYDWAGKAEEIVQALATGLVSLAGVLVQASWELCLAAIEAINQVDWVSVGVNIVDFIVNGLVGCINGLIDAGVQMAQSIFSGTSGFDWIGTGVQIVTGVLSGIMNLLGSLFQVGCYMAQKVFTGIGQINFIQAGLKIITDTIGGIGSAIGRMYTKGVEAARNAFNGLRSINFVGVGVSMINGVVSGIASAAGNLVSAAVNAGKNALNAMMRSLGIHSPSKVFRDKVGLAIPAGVAVGIEKGSDMMTSSVVKAAKSTVNAGVDAVQTVKPVGPLLSTAGSGSNQEMTGILTEILAELKKGKDIYIDKTKITKTLYSDLKSKIDSQTKLESMLAGA